MDRTSSLNRPAASRAPERAAASAEHPALRLGRGALLIAVVAGIAEATMSVAGAAAAGDAAAPAFLVQVLVHAAVYATALVMIVLLGRGRVAAWWVLLLGLGVVGLGSLVGPAVAEMLAGADLGTALGGDVNPWFVPVRALHIVTVVVGSVALLVAGPASVRAQRCARPGGDEAVASGRRGSRG